MAAWLDVDAVRAHIGLDPADTFDDAWLAEAVDAAADVVERLRADLLDDLGAYTPTPSVHTGAVMLAARVYARRNSPTGLAQYGDLGAAIVPRLDADIERLLGLGAWAPPRVR